MDEVKTTVSQSLKAVRKHGPRMVRVNFLYALISLAIGCLVWFGIDIKRTEEREFEVEVEFTRQLPADWKFIEPPAGVVKVKLRGPRQDIANLRKEEMSVEPDMPGFSEQAADYYDIAVPLVAANLRGVPVGVEVVSFEPDVLKARIAKTLSKYLTVVPGEITGAPAEGWVVGNIRQIDPPMMPVTGFGAFLAKLTPSDVLKTRPFSVEGGSGRVGGMVGLEPFEKDGETVRVPGMVYLTVELEEIPAQREFEQPFEVRALIESPFDRYSDLNVSPPSVKVTVAGPKTVVDRLREGDITIYADIRDRVPAAPGEFNLKCRAIVPPRVKVVRIEPDTVKWLTREHSQPAEAAPVAPATPAVPATSAAPAAAGN